MPSEKETIRVQLNYPPERVTQPILYHLVIDHGLIPNIRRANMDTRHGGFLFLELTGEKEALEAGLRFLQECGIQVSAIGMDGTQEWAI